MSVHSPGAECVNQIYIAKLCDLDERVWEVFRTHATERGPIELPGTKRLISTTSGGGVGSSEAH